MQAPPAAAAAGARPATAGASAASAAVAAVAAGRRRWAGHLAELVAIPSVSADPRHDADVLRAANWLYARLRAIGVPRAGILRTPGKPLVWGRCPGPAGAPAVLCYGHYDVVGPGPRGDWRTPPFSPRIEGRFLYGRGASDDKGPLLAQVAALEAWLSAGGPPVSVSCIFEGEEEIGSPSLRRILAAGSLPARADAVLISDTRMLAPGRPALVTGLRGSLAAEIEVRALPHDLHSGAFGGAVHNAAHSLCALLGSLHDDVGRAAIPGFYDDVRRPARAGRDAAAEILVADQMLAHAGPGSSFGEPGFSPYERVGVRPALDVNGISAGHSGPGAKGIVPARASAKLSFRLVPNQDPDRVASLLRRHVARAAPAGVRVSLAFSKPSRPVSIDLRSPALSAAQAALAAGFGRRPALLRSGGSIPVVSLLAQRVGPPVLMGFARPDDGMHAPNERVDLEALAAGAGSIVRFLGLMGAGRRRGAPILARELVANR